MRCFCVIDLKQPLQAVNLETPTPTGTEVLLKVSAAGVCHSDLHIWEGGYDLGNGNRLSLKDRGLVPPLTMGHETVGTVQAMGPQAQGLAQGRQYLVFPWIGCGECPACVRGKENYCAAPRYLGVQKPGGYADHILVPHPRYLIDIGDLDPALIAPYACSGLTTYSALRQIGPEIYTKTPVVIMGGGGLGLMCTQLVQALGGKGAIVVDIDPKKRAAALEAGAIAAIDGAAPDAAAQLTQAMGGVPLQAVVDTVGATSTINLAINTLSKGGMAVIIGLFGGATSVSNAILPMKALSLVGSYTGSLEELKELMALVREGRIKPIPVTRRPLEEAAQALESLHEGKVVGRVVLVP